MSPTHIIITVWPHLRLSPSRVLYRPNLLLDPTILIPCTSCINTYIYRAPHDISIRPCLALGPARYIHQTSSDIRPRPIHPSDRVWHWPHGTSIRLRLALGPARYIHQTQQTKIIMSRNHTRLCPNRIFESCFEPQRLNQTTTGREAPT